MSIIVERAHRADTARPIQLHPVEQPQHRQLTRDDLKLLAVISTGIPLTSVAERLGVSDRTVRRRIRTICDTIGVTTMIESVTWAARRRLI